MNANQYFSLKVGGTNYKAIDGFGWKGMAGADFAFTEHLKLTAGAAYHSSEPTRKRKFAMDLRGLEITGGLKIVLF